MIELQYVRLRGRRLEFALKSGLGKHAPRANEPDLAFCTRRLLDSREHLAKRRRSWSSPPPRDAINLFCPAFPFAKRPILIEFLERPRQVVAIAFQKGEILHSLPTDVIEIRGGDAGVPGLMLRYDEDRPRT